MVKKLAIYDVVTQRCQDLSENLHSRLASEPRTVTEKEDSINTHSPFLVSLFKKPRDWIFSGAVAPVMLVQKQGSYLRFLANRITLADPIVINKATIT